MEGGVKEALFKEGSYKLENSIKGQKVKNRSCLENGRGETGLRGFDHSLRQLSENWGSRSHGRSSTEPQNCREPGDDVRSFLSEHEYRYEAIGNGN